MNSKHQGNSPNVGIEGVIVHSTGQLLNMLLNMSPEMLYPTKYYTKPVFCNFSIENTDVDDATVS